MRPSNWTLLSWAVSFGQYGMYIAVIGTVALATSLGGLWWGDRRNRARREAIQAAHDAAPRPAPAWAHPDLPDDGDWERLHGIVHQHEHRGDDQQQCEEIYRQEETK
jgi:hypothetical protein